MQKIERKHLTLRTRLNRLARKTLCFSHSFLMHDYIHWLIYEQRGIRLHCLKKSRYQIGTLPPHTIIAEFQHL